MTQTTTETTARFLREMLKEEIYVLIVIDKATGEIRMISESIQAPEIVQVVAEKMKDAQIEPSPLNLS